MEKKFMRRLIKKLIIVILVFAILQSYIGSFALFVKAANELTIGGNAQVEDNQVVIGETENKVENESNVKPEETENENNSSGNEFIIGEETNKGNDSEGDVIAGNQEKPSEGENNQEIPPEGDVKEEKNPEEQETNTPGETDETGNTEENKPEDGVIYGEVEDYVEPDVKISVTSENTSIYKGYLYANATSDLRYATNYNTIDEVNIIGGKNMTKVIVQDEADKIGLITNTKVALLNDMYYRQTRISKEEFKNILGEDGLITLYDENGSLLGNINKETEEVNGEYTFTYPYQTNSVRFEITGIKSDGNIRIKNDKAIKESSLYSRNQISLFSNINTIANIQMEVNNEIRSYQAEGNINLEETESRMTIDVDKDTLSVEEPNEMAITVTLKTDQERYDLFENPEIVLEFPSAIEDLEVTGINLLYKNALTIEDWNVYKNQTGKQVLNIRLSGSQLEYTPGSVQEGTTIVVYVKAGVNRLTADTKENLKLTYTNKDTIRKTYMLEGKDSEDVTLSFVGRQEVVKASRVTLANVGTAVSYDEGIETIEVAADKDEEQLVTITGDIVNNFETEVGNVVIVGRIPFEGNKDGNGKDLGTTFNTKLVAGISLSGVVADVYYSESADAGKEDSSWTQDTSDLTKFKSYKIVVREGKLLKGDSLRFEYNVNVPANVGYNAKAFGTYTVYYELDEQVLYGICTVGIVTEEMEEAVIIGKVEDTPIEEISNLSIGTQVTICDKLVKEDEEIFERQALKYTILVTNNSDKTVRNININAKPMNANIYDWYYSEIPDGVQNVPMKYMKEYTNDEKENVQFTIDTLAPNGSKAFEYEVIVKSLNEIENPEVYSMITILADGMQENNIMTQKNKLKNAEIEIKTEKATTESLEDTENLIGGMQSFGICLKNISGRDLKNVSVEIYLTDTLSIIENKNYMFLASGDDLNIRIEKTENGTKLIAFFENFESDFDDVIGIYTNINKKPYTVKDVNLAVYAIAKTEENTYMSNITERKAIQTTTKIEHTWTCDNDKEILHHGDEINFELNIKNVGYVDILNLFVKSNFTKGLWITKATIINNDGEKEVNILNGDLELTNYILIPDLNINKQSEITLKITASIDSEKFEVGQETVEAYISAYGSDSYNFDTEVMSFKIDNPKKNVEEPKPDEPVIPDPELPVPDDNNKEPIKKETYDISGKVWLDKNKDGINNGEPGKEAVVVVLYGTNEEAMVDISKVISTEVTNAKGEYKFTGIEAGNYVIAFCYDTSIYNITKYQVSGASSSENSDAVSKKITYGDSSQIVGMTDVLTISNSGLLNIDMGLVTKNDFDLALDKYITKVEVKNNKGTQTYNYNNGLNEKVEIRSKYYKTSTLDITYKFVIKNEGEVVGYVNKLVDYLPEGTTVDLSANPGWYYGDDNNLYYNGLVGKEIKEGSTVEVLLTISKSLEDGESVVLKNAGEIAEYTNALGFEDIDSVSKNKMENEDDYGSATLLITISTGIINQYTVTILLLIIIVISISIIIVIKKESIKKF